MFSLLYTSCLITSLIKDEKWYIAKIKVWCSSRKKVFVCKEDFFVLAQHVKTIKIACFVPG